MATRRFEEALLAAAERTVLLRLGADYEARPVEREEAEAVVELAARFLSAIEAVYPD